MAMIERVGPTDLDLGLIWWMHQHLHAYVMDTCSLSHSFITIDMQDAQHASARGARH